jgi:hypothetical protein
MGGAAGLAGGFLYGESAEAKQQAYQQAVQNGRRGQEASTGTRSLAAVPRVSLD